MKLNTFCTIAALSRSLIVACSFGMCGAATAAPSLRAHSLSQAPQLDGNVVDDAAWSGAQPATDFSQTRPDEGQASTQRTEVFVGYTDTALYIGVVCYDDNPEGIITSENRRDVSLSESDSFQVLIDGFKDGQNGFIFGTTPSGVEHDAQVTGESIVTTNWDTTWQVRAQMSEIGWSAEMEIPFNALRYGAGEVQDWGINFQRNIRRNNEVTYWSPLPRQFNLLRVSMAGSLTGLRVPVQRNFKVTPYALVKAERGGTLPDGTHTKGEAGVDVKYSITRSLTLDATYNTDFAQVEADDFQVSLDRFSLFFPEKRPFFLENAGYFQVGSSREIEMFFSRRIGVSATGMQLPVEGGVRVSGKIGSDTNVGFLHMRTDDVPGVAPQNDFSVLRVNQQLPNRSSIGVFVANRNGDGSHLLPNEDDYNRSYAIDGRWGIGTHTLISGFVAKTDTPGVRGRDHAGALRVNYDSENWSNFAAYTEVGNEFQPEVGFLSRRDYRRGDVRFLRRIRPDNFWGLHELRPHISYRGIWDFEGFHESGFLHVDNHWEFQNDMEVHTGMNITHEGVQTPFTLVRDVTIPVGRYDHTEAQLVFMTDQSLPWSIFTDAIIGGFYGGDRVTVRPSVRYRPADRFSAELSYNYNDIDLPAPNEQFYLNLTQLRLTYYFSSKVALQGLVQYNERDDLLATNLRFSWLQSANSGLYLVYNEVDDESPTGPPTPRRELILKYSYIFDVLR